MFKCWTELNKEIEIKHGDFNTALPAIIKIVEGQLYTED